MKPRSRLRHCALGICLLTVWPTLASAQPEDFAVVVPGTTIGHLTVKPDGAALVVDFDYKDNGRGPTMIERLTLDASGLPTRWTLTGTTTFGSMVDERFEVNGTGAAWADSAGTGEATVESPPLYVAQSGSPWAVGLYARALLDRGGEMPVLPGGTLRLEQGETLTFSGSQGTLRATAYAVSGIDLNPHYLLLDDDGKLFAAIGPRIVTVRRGFEGEAPRLRQLATSLSTNRYEAIQRDVAHRFAGPIRIRNVRVFDPATRSLSPPVSVVVHGNVIAGVQPTPLPRPVRSSWTAPGAPSCPACTRCTRT